MDNLSYMTSATPTGIALTLLREILKKQQEQNNLLQILVNRQSDITQHVVQWKKENPVLSRRCTNATQRAHNLMTGLIENLVTDLEDISSSADLNENFALFELIDKYGYRIQQFNLILHILSQLGAS